jgi:TRAP-type transport system periplasmic protein
MWKRTFGVISIMIMSAVALGALGISTPGDAMAKTRVINIATHYPPPDVRSQAYNYWADQVKERTRGEIKLQIHYGGSLVPLPEVFDAVSQGVADGGTLVASYISGTEPDFTPFEIFYAYDPDKWLALDERAKGILDEILKKHNIKYLGGSYIGSVALSCRDKLVKKTEDWKGLKVRTAGRWQAEAIQAWGGKPVTIALGEMYTSLQTGVVDAGLLVYSLIDSFKMYEVAPNITHLGSIPQWDGTGINLKVWNSLSSEDQKILLDTDRMRRDFLDQKGKDLDGKVIAKLKERGVKFYRPEGEDLKGMKNAVQPLWGEVGKVVSPRGKQLIEILREFQ